MIAILKIDSVDFINVDDSKNKFLCFIPSNRLKANLKNILPIQELFEDNSYFIDKDENLIYESEIPPYFWKFIQYALSNKFINPSDYNKLCQLLLATPQTPENNIYNFASESQNILRNNIYPSLTATYDTINAYNKEEDREIPTPAIFFKNGINYTTNNHYNPQTDSLKFYCKSYNTNSDITLTQFYRAGNTTDPNTYARIRIQNNKAIFQIKKNSSTAAIALEIAGGYIESYLKETAFEIINNADENSITIKGAYSSMINSTLTAEKVIPKASLPTSQIFAERIGAFIYRPANATVNSTLSGNKHILNYELYINENPVTIINAEESKILTQELLNIA